MLKLGVCEICYVIAKMAWKTTIFTILQGTYKSICMTLLPSSVSAGIFNQNWTEISFIVTRSCSCCTNPGKYVQCFRHFQLTTNSQIGWIPYSTWLKNTLLSFVQTECVIIIEYIQSLSQFLNQNKKKTEKVEGEYCSTYYQVIHS